MDYDVVPNDKSILLALRDAAKIERDANIRNQMKATADSLDVEIRNLCRTPTPAVMRRINGEWVLAIHYLSIAKGGPDNGPNKAGMAEGALLTVAA